MTAKTAMIRETTSARFELEVTVQAPRERVWEALVRQPDGWWISELRVVPGDSELTLDPVAGGRMIERNADGASLLWFTVIAIEPPRSINLEGALAPPFGGPSQAFLLIELEERDGATVVKMTNSLHGHVEESMLPQMEGGWRMLLENGIKAFVETGQRR